MHIAVPTDSNLLDMPSISQPASKLSRGTLAVEQEKEGELATTSLEFEFHFQFPYGSPTTELTVRFPPNSTKRKQLQVYTNIKSQCQGYSNNVVTNVISANQHFTSTFSKQILKFQRHSCKLLLPLPAPPPGRPGELARRLSISMS